MKIFVARMSYDTTEDKLRSAFEDFGVVDSCKIIYDREENRSKGFGFIEMPDKAQGEAAINAINQTDVQGRSVRVNEARPRNDNRGGGRR